MVCSYLSKEQTEALIYRNYPEYSKYIRSALYDAHILDKELEEFDPLLQKFKVLEEKMKEKKISFDSNPNSVRIKTRIETQSKEINLEEQSIFCLEEKEKHDNR